MSQSDPKYVRQATELRKRVRDTGEPLCIEIVDATALPPEREVFQNLLRSLRTRTGFLKGLDGFLYTSRWQDEHFNWHSHPDFPLETKGIWIFPADGTAAVKAQAIHADGWHVCWETWLPPKQFSWQEHIRKD